MLLAARSGDTGRGSMPAARSRMVLARRPRTDVSCAGGATARSRHVRMPAASSRATADLPSPNSTETDCGASQSAASAMPMVKNPSGLSRSDAILASDLVPLKPMDTVMPISLRMVFCIRTSASAGLQPCSFCVPVISRKASSIEMGCTSGVSASM